jgi:two-component system, NtrC family, sensor kinase
MSTSDRWIAERAGSQGSSAAWGRFSRPALPVVVVSVLLCLGAANIASRAAFREVEDGVLWALRAEGVVAAEIADGTPAAAVGIERGDLLLSINDRPIEDPADVVEILHGAGRGETLRYTVLRLGSRDVIDVRVAPVPGGPGILYFLLAGVGTFTLLVGGAVRVRRPRDPATLHFLWLSVAFFGVFTFSFSGRLDRLDWVFFWADEVSILALPPLFLHFTLVFPERSSRLNGTSFGRLLEVANYTPAVVLGLARVASLARASTDAAQFVRVSNALERMEFLYLAVCFIGGLLVLTRALRRVRTVTARRQLRWIAWGTAFGAGPFAFGYALPYALGVMPSLPMQLLAIPLSLIPLAYASAIVRYRLMDVEVIVKRALVYAAVLSAVVAMYVVLLKVVQRVFDQGSAGHEWVIAFLATLVAVLLAPPVKDFVQTTLDRAFYRDRYDYRRALVGFARDLNSDLDLGRLSGRLVSRVVETLEVDCMALMVESESGPDWVAMHAYGFPAAPPALAKLSGIGRRIAGGNLVALDDPTAVGWFAAEEIEFWRDAGLYYFVPCLAQTGATAVLALGRKHSSEPLSSEDMALLAAVAAQMATALENARLYRQLQVKALELDRLRAFNENILESLDDGLLVVDLHDKVVRWNTALETLYGVSHSAAASRAIDDLFDGPCVEAIRAARRDSPTGAVLSRVPLHCRGAKAGHTLIVNCTVVPLRVTVTADALAEGTVVILEDVTSRVQFEEQLQISEKMASIGLLAAGVAHEVNTPLTGISSFTQMLLEGADPDDPKTRLLEKIERQTFRAAKIVNGLLNLSRPASNATASELAVVDLNVVIADVLGLLEHQFGTHSIKLRRELSETPVMVLGMEHKLQQVFLNLFLNAKDAMPKGGWLSVRTSLDGDRGVAVVSDTGSGIPNEYLARIYDPFFTTKAMNQGTGLGLSITYGIVREHEGSIDCDSQVGQGTRFVLAFPLARTRPALATRH